MVLGATATIIPTVAIVDTLPMVPVRLTAMLTVVLAARPKKTKLA